MAPITNIYDYDEISALKSSSYRQFSLAEIEEAPKNSDRKMEFVFRDDVENVGNISVDNVEGKSELTYAYVMRFNSNSKFKREVCGLMKIQEVHKNSVPLIGYCIEESDKPLLVYKYMQNGRLSNYKNDYKSWSWKRKLKICLQVAYSLQALHSPTSLFPFGLTHGLVNPSNIWLDENWDAGLLNFVYTYIAEESPASEDYFTKLKDVNAFGSILLKFLPCNESFSVKGFIKSIQNNDFEVWAKKYITLESESEDELLPDSLKAFFDATRKCLESEWDKCATMDEVVLDLEAALTFQDLFNSSSKKCFESNRSKSATPSFFGTIRKYLESDRSNSESDRSNSESDRSKITTIDEVVLDLEAALNFQDPTSLDLLKSSLKESTMISGEITESSSSSSLSLFVPSYRQFSLAEIKYVTRNLDKERSHKEGIYWIEYLVLMNLDSKTEKTWVTVKQFKGNCIDEFEKEIQVVTKIQAHPNLISLLGYCIESGENILIYNYPENGSLLDYVDLGSPICLSWEERLNICLGAALGLQHLHQETNEFPDGIIHEDVNAANILIDKNWVAKVSNYAGSHIAQRRSTFSTTTVVEDPLRHYAPEYVKFRHLTEKVDVFAFGIVLFQVLCRRKIWVQGEESKLRYIEASYSRWAIENIDIAIKDGITEESLREFTDCIHRCLEPHPYKRPPMKSVVRDIKKALDFQVDEGEAIAINTSYRSSEDVVTTSGVSLSLSSSCCRFPLNEIKDATNNFEVKRLIGKGGEGTVYLAEVYLDSKTEKIPVAVKLLGKDFIGEFEKEIVTVTKIKHPNIVSLLGYCCESDSRALIYEYMAKGSLADYVKMNSKVCLSWKQRLNICLGAAYGLQHLHRKTEEFPYGIIHRDVKPENILINENWVAKVSDFGMLKLSNISQTRSTIFTGVARGTPGYFAPECALHSEKKLTRNIDVYSFGLVMFEVLCRKRMWEVGDESIYQESVNVSLLAYENIDIEIKHQISEESLYKFIDIIAKSLRSEPKRRPCMNDVVEQLEAALKCQEESEVVKEINAPS